MATAHSRTVAVSVIGLGISLKTHIEISKIPTEWHPPPPYVIFDDELSISLSKKWAFKILIFAHEAELFIYTELLTSITTNFGLRSKKRVFNFLVFTDEATFYLHRVVNEHNDKLWTNENPHWVREI